MISSLSVWNWIKLIGAFSLFLSPGLLFLSLKKTPKSISISMKIILAFGLSLGLWIILLIWFQLFKIKLDSWDVRIIFIILSFIYSIQLVRKLKQNNIQDIRDIPFGEIAIIGLSLLITAYYLYVYRNLLAGLGSDSMHHTLISSLFIEEGSIPKDYGPYAPVQTFSYHFGFHSFIAAMTWLSGIPTRLMVVISGAILIGLASLAGAALVLYTSKNRVASLSAITIIGLIYVFPSYSLLWGRYTQLMGTIILMIFMLALMAWEETKFSTDFIPTLVLITSALLFSHYRLFIAGGLFTFIYLVVRKNLWLEVKNHFLNWLAIPVGSLALSSPWLIQLYFSRQQGYSIENVRSTNYFYSLERLGPDFFSEVQTWVLIYLSILIIVIGLIKRDRLLAILFLWIALLGVFSRPMFLGESMDPVTMMISSYVPIVLIIGVAIDQLIKIDKHINSRLIIKSLILTILIFGGVAGSSRWMEINLYDHCFVSSDDVKAGEWIKNNVKDDALFMISTYQFPMNKHLIIGLDGGYWLPITADRKSVVPPMVYLFEKMIFPGAEKKVVEFHNGGNKLITTEIVNFLRNNAVTHIYLSTQNELIKDNLLLKSLGLKLVYQKGNVQILYFLENP